MKISEIAAAAEVSKDAVRHYVELGLLQVQKNPSNGYQMFGQEALTRLQFIKAARDLGFKLSDIQLIFADAEQSASPCPRVRDLILERLHETRQRIRELSDLCDRMSKAVEQWQEMPDCIPNGESVCQLIESQFFTSRLAAEGAGEPTP